MNAVTLSQYYESTTAEKLRVPCLAQETSLRKQPFAKHLAKNSVRITNSPLIFSDTSCLKQVQHMFSQSVRIPYLVAEIH